MASIDKVLSKVREWFLPHTPDWIVLRKFGQSKLLKSSYFWFFFVPICAKALQGLEPPLVIKLPDAFRSNVGEISLHLSLPFSWQMMFFTSVSFTFGSILFAFRCPRLIGEFVSPFEFAEKGWSPFHIWQFLEQTRKKELPPYVLEKGYVSEKDFIRNKHGRKYFHGEQSMKDFWEHYVPIDNENNTQLMHEHYEAMMPPNGPEEEYTIPNTPWHKPISDDHFKLLFQGAQLEMQTMYFWSRWWCSLCFGLGIVLMCGLAIQSIYVVWKMGPWF